MNTEKSLPCILYVPPIRGASSYPDIGLLHWHHEHVPLTTNQRRYKCSVCTTRSPGAPRTLSRIVGTTTRCTIAFRGLTCTASKRRLPFSSQGRYPPSRPLLAPIFASGHARGHTGASKHKRKGAMHHLNLKCHRHTSPALVHIYINPQAMIRTLYIHITPPTLRKYDHHNRDQSLALLREVCAGSHDDTFRL